MRELFSLLDRGQKRQLLSLQLLVILMAISEVASVLAIGPFMSLVGDIQRLEGNGFLARVYQEFEFESPDDFLFTTGLVALFVLALAASISSFTLWKLSMFGSQVGADLGNRLYRYYLLQPWVFHTTGNSSHLTSKIAQECQRISIGIIQPLMQINARLVAGSLIALTMFIYNPVVAAFGLLLFSSAYWLLYKTVQRKLQRNGQTITLQNNLRFKLMNEGFGGVKDILLHSRQSHFITEFTKSNNEMAHAVGNTNVLSLVPRFAMELLAFGAVIGLVLYLLKTYESDLGQILPSLSIYALAGFKLLPALQQVYAGFTRARGNVAALDNLRFDLQASRVEAKGSKASSKLWLLRQSIELREINFCYPGMQEPALKSLNISIPANCMVGIVGASGSGKSTAIDILLGLLAPDEGQVIVDGEALSDENSGSWQSALGYVPQSIFLADTSICENVAFGIAPEKIDYCRVERAVGLAQLDEFLDSLPEGLATRVGERGIQLSGGQRQRIGIARALYQNPQVLVLDEATNALDGLTEQLVMDAVNNLAGKKTLIIIAHRLATVKQCDIIYMLKSGRVVDQGSYLEMIERNPSFRQMAGLH